MVVLSFNMNHQINWSGSAKQLFRNKVGGVLSCQVCAIYCIGKEYIIENHKDDDDDE